MNRRYSWLLLSHSLLMDYYGRFKPIITGPLMMLVCMVIVASMLVRYGSPCFGPATQSVNFKFVNTAAGNTVVAFFILYMIASGASIAALLRSYQNEILPINIRDRGTALSTSTNSFVNSGLVCIYHKPWMWHHGKSLRFWRHKNCHVYCHFLISPKDMRSYRRSIFSSCRIIVGLSFSIRRPVATDWYSDMGWRVDLR